jgi:hypothetical protein
MYARTHFAAISDNKMRLLYTKPLLDAGIIDVYVNKHSLKSDVRQMFGISSSEGYAARYALTQKGRLLVQKIYRKLEGREAINADE